MQNNVAIKLLNISKRYYIHHEKPTLVERIVDGKNDKFWALRNLTLTIQKGDRLGIIGPNGSGKTTLLKIITGITTATSGIVDVTGRVISLIDLEAGFHPDLTGIQNIYLNGIILGMKNDEISSQLKKIIKFADIGKFIDTELYTYSQGMKLRLGFSIAVHANPDILVLDENIAVGDQVFRKSAYEKLRTFIKAGKTIVVASHDLAFIKNHCNRAIELDKGKIVRKGDPNKIVNRYLNMS